MGIAKEIIDMQSKLQGERATYDDHCREIAEVLLPRQNQFHDERKVPGEKRTEKVISSVAMEALNRFASAYESVTTPGSSKWHGLTIDGMDEDHEAKEALDNINDTLFKYRYSSKSNFASQNHETNISVGAFGTGVLITEDNGKNGVLYRASHISEHFFMENKHGLIDINYRKYRLSARQAVQKFGRNLPQKILDAAEKTPYEQFDFIHCVKPNDDFKYSADDFRGMKFSSFHVSIEGNHFITQGGFRTFPFHINRYVTAPNEIYGRSPGMTALPEIKMVNAIRKSDLRARHMAIDPPILGADERGMGRPKMQPGAFMPGTLDANGNPLLKPYNNQSRIDVSNDAIEQSHKIINDIFLVTLFQILVESPAMTATEVLQRAQEKGALLAPTAGRMQSEYIGPLIEREIDILAYNGLLPDLPDSLKGREFEIEYTAPVNLMQKAEQATAAQRLIEATVPLAQIDPSIMDNIDLDEYVEIIHESLGVPARMIRSKEEKQSMREQKSQAQQLQQLASVAPQVAGSIKDIAQAQSYAQ